MSATFIGETSELLIVDATGNTYRCDLGTDAMVAHHPEAKYFNAG